MQELDWKRVKNEIFYGSLNQDVFIAMGVRAFPTGNVKGRQEIMNYFG